MAAIGWFVQNHMDAANRRAMARHGPQQLVGCIGRRQIGSGVGLYRPWGTGKLQIRHEAGIGLCGEGRGYIVCLNLVESGRRSLFCNNPQ
jgi:hypothetical protein